MEKVCEVCKKDSTLRLWEGIVGRPKYLCEECYEEEDVKEKVWQGILYSCR